MPSKEKILLDGSHLMLDCFGASPKILADKEFITNFLSNLPAKLGMKKIHPPVVIEYKGGETWDRGGITGMVFIAESHISIHTFPHDGFYTADVYSCKPFDQTNAVNEFKTAFKHTREKIQCVKRDILLVREHNMCKMNAKTK